MLQCVQGVMMVALPMTVKTVVEPAVTAHVTVTSEVFQLCKCLTIMQCYSVMMVSMARTVKTVVGTAVTAHVTVTLEVFLLSTSLTTKACNVTECDDGQYGQDCQNHCGDGCSLTCNKTVGSCPCTDGWMSPLCRGK